MAWQGTAWHGWARLGKARLGKAGLGKARQGKVFNRGFVMKESFSSLIARLNTMPDDEHTYEHLLKMKEKIAWLCLNKPYVKGSYAALVQAYWRRFCGLNISGPTFEKLLRAPSPDSISRVYRFLQEDAAGTEWEHKLMPSDGKRLKRRLRQHVMHDIAVSGL